MPTLRMNKMLSAECLGTEEFHAFCNSTEILEGSHSHQITYDQIALDSTSENHQNFYSISEVSGEDIGIAEVNFFQDEHNGATTSLLPLSLLSCDPRSVTSSASCSSDLKKVFSPYPSDSESKEMSHSNTVRDEKPELLPLILGNGEDGYSASSEFQIWDVMDFYFSESIPAVQFDSLMDFTNDATTSYHDCMNIVDMAEKCMILPFLDKTEDTNNANDEALVKQTMLKSDETCLYLQTEPSDPETKSSSGSSDAGGIECLDQQLHSHGLCNLMDIDSTCPIVSLKLPDKRKSITLVLDLDETLVHSTLEHCDNADFTLQVFCNMTQHTVYVRQRPHLQMFLDKVAQMFEIVIFTASQKIYAEQLIDKLDPDGQLISRRIYRDSCIFSDGSYTKDLTILGVDLAKIAIIDNTPQVFQLQVDNGIPIKSWFDDPSDNELVELLPFLATLVDAHDVRPIISKTFSDKDTTELTRPEV